MLNGFHDSSHTGLEPFSNSRGVVILKLQNKSLMRVALSVGSFVLTLMALEIGLRLYGYDQLGHLRTEQEYTLRPSSHPDLKFELTPGGFGTFADTYTRINSQGFRGPEPLSNPARRVILLGDSITFGHFMNWEDTFASQLQERLSPTRQEIEILNFGVGGYDVLQEVSLLEIRGLKYHPDLVVVAYCLNDISIASTSVEQIERRRSQRWNFLYHSRLAQFLSVNIEQIRLKRWLKQVNDPEAFHREYEHEIDPIGPDEVELLNLMKNAPTYPSTTQYGDRDRVGRLRYSFRRLSNMSKENGFPVVIMIVPLLLTDGGTYTHATAHRIVAMEARRAGFDTVDLTESFMRVGMDNLKSEFGDIIHPNKRGHSIMAGLLSDYIESHLQRGSRKQTKSP